MPGKKAHKPRDTATVKGGKNAAQTRGQFERDPKGRQGQYGAAGDAPLTKK